MSGGITRIEYKALKSAHGLAFNAVYSFIPSLLSTLSVLTIAWIFKTSVIIFYYSQKFCKATSFKSVGLRTL